LSINLAEGIRQLLTGIKELGGLQILLVVFIVQCLWFGWAMFLRHRANVAQMNNLTKLAIASMEEQTKLAIASLEQPERCRKC
jgi:hypothetical protein